MPVDCDTTSAGRSAVKHNPAAYYLAIRGSCRSDDLALVGNLDRDLAAGTLPSFSFVTPNLCDDTHDCAVSNGDSWLAVWVPKILAGVNYRSGDTLVIITWDEGSGAANQIPTLVIGSSVRPGVVAEQRFDHYSLLRTTEDVLGLPHLGAAATAASMSGAFGL